MATFEELFPDSPQAAPFEPLQPAKIDQRLVDLRSRVRQAIPTGVGADGVNSGNGQFLNTFGDLLNEEPTQKTKPQTEWKDYGKAAIAGVGDIGQMAAGAGEYVANRFVGEGSTPGEQLAGDVAGSFRRGRLASQDFANDWSQSMSPEAQDRAARELMTLDPNKTIWQGNPREFLSSIALKMSRSAPSTLTTLLPGALMLRAGLMGGGLVYLGASEGGLSMGQIAANIAQEVEEAPEEELMQSARYKEFRKTMPDPEARQALIRESQGYAPVIGGIVTGAISAATGRYLEPVLVDGGKGVFSRFARGFAAEGIEEGGQSGNEQIAQNWAAQTFDSDRSLMQGVPEQVVQGAVVGGATGGGTAAVVGSGHGRTALPQEGEVKPSGNLNGDRAAPRTKSFDEVFRTQTPPEGGWQGGDIENANVPDVDAQGQRLLNVGPVDPDVQAALNARRENRIQDMFEQPPQQTPQEEQASYLQRPFPNQQQSMELPQASTAMVPATGTNEQLPLGLSERQRGGPPQIIQPTPAQPLNEDLSAPPEYSAERPAANVLPNGARPTRADFIRQSVEAQRAQRTQGMVRDENQMDMLNPQQQLTPDLPSAEPLSDLKAQLEDLRDPDSERLGVYLSAANIAQLRRDGTFEQVRGVGVPLANFDGTGGTLIAKNRKAASELNAMRSQGAGNMQEILGLATGAGSGKPAGAQIAVQQRDAKGNVVRESLVATPEEADALAAQYDTPGHEGVVISADMAIKRRAIKIKQESRQAGAKRDVKQVRRFAEDVIEKELGDTPLAGEAKKKIGRSPLSENEAARKLVGYASRLRKRELTKNVGEVSHPDVVRFADTKTTEDYKNLFGEYRDAQIAQHMASTAEESLKAKSKSEGLRRQIGAFRRINKSTSPSEEVARVARRISPEEVRKIEREARETARSAPKTESTDVETRTALEKSTDDQLKSMSDSELNMFFTEAANVASGSRVARTATSKEGGTAERYATTLFTPHGKTIDEILQAYPTRSEKLKLVARVKRMLEMRKHGGKSKTTPITSKAGVRKSLDEKVAIRKSTFNPTKALDLNPPREMSSEQASKHNARVREAYHELDKSITGVKKAIDSVMRPLFMNMARSRESENGNPPQNARDIVYGRVYLRTLYRYGQLLNQLHGRSVSAIRETERYNKIVNELLDAPKDKFLATLAKLTEAEIGEQVKTTARVDPTNLGFLSNRKKRALATLESVSRLKEQVAWSKRLHDKWHTNMYFNNFVAPLMQKLIGYTTRDAAPWNYAIERRGLGATPTLQEMQGLGFALKRFRSAASTRIDLFDPLKRFFSEFGFKFDGNELAIPMKNGELDYDNEATLLRKMRDRFAYNHPLTPEERTAEVATRRQREATAQFARDEKARQSNLTPEQRALEADQNPKLNLEIADATASRPQMLAAARKLGAILEAEPLASLNDTLKAVASLLPANHAYQPWIQRLLALGMNDAIVTWDRSGNIVGENSPGHFDDNLSDSTGQRRRVIRLNRPYFENWRSLGYDPSGHLIHTLLHEAVHSATVGALQRNRGLQVVIKAIMQQSQRQLEASDVESKHYGFKNEKEFVAEAFTNPAFQDALRSVEVTKGHSVWDWIVNFVRRLLGVAESAKANNALEVVMMTSDRLFTGELREKNQGSSVIDKLEDEPGVMSKISNVYDKAMQSNRVTQDVRKKASNIIEKNREGGNRFMLSALTMEQIRDFYAKSFGGSGGSLSEYMKAFFRREADMSANLVEPTRMSQRWVSFEEKTPEQALEFSRIATEASLYGIHPDKPLTSKLNQHIQSNDQKQRHAELSRRYNSLSGEAKQLFAEVQDFYSSSMEREVNLMTLNALRATVGQGSFNYTENDVVGKNLNTLEGLKNEFGDKLTSTERKVIANMAAIPQRFIGPYFPLMRYGDYVVTAKRVKEAKSFDDIKEARAWVEEQRESDPTLSVSPPMETDGGYIVTVREEEVRMAESPSEAEENRKEMMAEYGRENVWKVQLKAQLYQQQGSIESNRGLKTILDKLSGNPAAQAAIKDFYLRSLADKSFRKHEIRRQNRRGVDYETQHRAFNNYAKSAAYYTAQLRFGWQMADGLIGMQKYVDETAHGEHTSSISAVRMGEVVRELDTRNKLTTDPIQASNLVRKGTALSQFMMLTSPSYWIINSTQPCMVTLPWLAAHTSMGEATASLLSAQKLIAHPILNQMGESYGGLKALWSRTAAENAFSVLDQLESYIAKRAGPRAGEYKELLKFLKLHNVLDMTMNTEFRSIAEGANSSWTSRVMDASRIMSHLTEVNNRVMTALAAYDIYRNRGMSVQAATGFAQQAVSLTQFNYSSGNTPRLFGAKGPLGQAGPLVFQFMKYPQHMYALLIDNFRRAVKSGGMDRKIAIKTLSGILATHLAAGGLVGAMIQPIKWAIGLMMAAFGDDDKDYTVANALSGETVDRWIRKATTELFGTEAGEILSAGLPRAVGIDVSNRMSLGTLYFLDLKTDTAESTLGSLLSGFGGPTVNLGMNAWHGAQYFEQGQYSKALEMVLPKFGKDALRAIRYTNEGLTDATGKEILNAKQLSPWELFSQSIGFAPAEVAEKYAQRAAIKDAEQYDIQRKNALMQRFRSAKNSDARATVLADVAEFNKKNPGEGITRSELIKSMHNFTEASSRSKTMGLNLQKKQRVYLEEGEPYNVEENDE